MRYIISAENFLINYLANYNNEIVSFEALRNAKNAVTQAVDDDIYIDITLESISKLITARDRFLIGRRRMRLAKSFKKKVESAKYINDTYNWQLPGSIKTQYLKAVSQIARQKL